MANMLAKIPIDATIKSRTPSTMNSKDRLDITLSEINMKVTSWNIIKDHRYLEKEAVGDFSYCKSSLIDIYLCWKYKMYT